MLFRMRTDAPCPDDGDSRGMNRLAIVVALKEGAHSEAERLLFKGPPFDPGEAGFTRHAVYLTSKEVVFVFEGPEAEWSLDDLVSDFFHPALHMAELEWKEIEDAPPRLAREAYFWENHGGDDRS
jgi:hypothetical protein